MLSHPGFEDAPDVAERLRRQTAATRLIWIAGNHDGLAGGAWGGEVADEMVVDGILLVQSRDGKLAAFALQ